MSAKSTRTNEVFALDRPPQLDERVTEDDVKDASKLARLLMRVLKDIATLKRRFVPRRIDFEDRAVLGGGKLRLNHGWGGRVRWWVVDWVPTSPTDSPVFERTTATDSKTLVLSVGNPGTVTIRVEESG